MLSKNQLNEEKGLLDFKTEEDKRLLVKIDKRLPKLLNIYNDFSSLNNHYINPKDNALTDDEYQKKISKIVNTHLKQRAMDLSQGVSSRFVQWLREHLFKRFTFGASKTEKQAIRWGVTFFQTTGIDSPESTDIPKGPGNRGLS